MSDFPSNHAGISVVIFNTKSQMPVHYCRYHDVRSGLILPIYT